MPAKNLYHDAVIDALIVDGWTVTHDPLTLAVDDRVVQIDLGAERSPIGAERGAEKIAVEVQSFVGASPVSDLHRAIGQYVIYRAVLAEQDPDRALFLAVPALAYNGILSERLGVMALAAASLRVLVFDPAAREVVRWTS